MNFLPQQFRLQPLCVLIAAALGSMSAWAIEPFKLKDIRVEGLQRIESGTVFAIVCYMLAECGSCTRR